MRKTIAVLIGAIVASAILFLVGMIANAINPTPPELMDPETPEAVARRVESASLFTWLTTVFGLALGAFSGGAIGAIIAREKIFWITGAISVVLSLWAFYTFYIVFPSVLWVPAAMLVSVIVFPYLGGSLISRVSRKNQSDLFQD